MNVSIYYWLGIITETIIRLTESTWIKYHETKAMHTNLGIAFVYFLASYLIYIWSAAVIQLLSLIMHTITVSLCLSVSLSLSVYVCSLNVAASESA